jgi:hypothetical protein
MPKWFQEMNGPIRLLWLYAISLGVATGVSPVDEGLPNRADLVSRLAFSLVLALWVIQDAAKRGRQLCHDYGAAVFFLWPVVVPVCLFQTKRVAGLRHSCVLRRDLADYDLRWIVGIRSSRVAMILTLPPCLVKPPTRRFRPSVARPSLEFHLSHRVPAPRLLPLMAPMTF